ncbi:Fur-regulated basic protein FbpA [Bacillus mangrovi]|uniref:Fur-regulated basic protein FbpA n=1 Tax=Metabacillus mangrovi TaxID=1491830 RepID=A0A7X2S645_9BACI|nr:Fur-regulated basic protein FbpA [Metabacillus mangrovi]MTH54317.1 Fur-regulated basic protein FbpA [Metabacillus mangrovi]
MSKLLKFALDEQRSYYSHKLLAIGVYNDEVLQKMTISELKNEYVYFYHSIPAIKRKPAAP